MPDKKKTSALPQPGFFHRLRTYFFTGLVVAAPMGITIYLIWWFVSFFDQWIKPYIPSTYNPDSYLPFSVPGVGLFLALFGITVIGAFTANLFGRTIIGLWERLLSSMPVVRTVYSALKQIFETVLSHKSDSFREVCLIEYPRKGLYAIAFVSCDSEGEVPARAKAGDLVSVFLPTTPNPTSGFLLFVPERDVIKLSMTVEEAAKLVISAGLVVPDHEVGAEAPDHHVPQITEKTAQEILKAQAKTHDEEKAKEKQTDAAE